MSEAHDTDTSPRDSSSPLRRLLVWGGSLLGGLAVLVLVAALLLPRLFTSEELKGYVIPPLEDATGREVQIDAIDLRVLPTPAVRLSGFRLANAEGFGPAPAVEARALDVNVALWPLFVGVIRPTSISLVDPVVRYEVAGDGSTNFDTFGGPAGTTRAKESLLGGIPVSDFRVSGARLQYVDRSTGRDLQFEFDARLNALPRGSSITSDGTVDVRTARAVLPGLPTDTLTVHGARVDYDLRVALGEGRVDLRDFRIKTPPLTVTAEGTLSRLKTRPTINLRIQTGTTDLARMAALMPDATIHGVNPQGSLELDGTLSGMLGGSPQSDLTVSATGRLAEVGIDYEHRSLLRDVNANLALSLDSISVRSLQGKLLGASLSGDVALRDLMAKPRLDLRLTTGPMALSAISAVAPTEQVEDFNPQGTLRLRTTVEGPVPESPTSLGTLTIEGTGRVADVGLDYGGEALLRGLKADLAFSNASVSVQSIDGTLLGNPLSGRVTVRNPLSTRRMEGQLAGTADLSELLALRNGGSDEDASVQGRADYDVHFSGPVDRPEAIQPEGQVRLSEVRYPYDSFRHPIEIPRVAVQLTGTGLSTDSFTVRSGDQTATLQTTVQDLFPLSEGLADANPALAAAFALTADRLDLAALYPAADPSAPSYAQLFAAHLSGSTVSGMSPDAWAERLYGGIELPTYTIDGRVEIDTLQNPPQRYDDVAFNLQLANRRLQIQDLSALTYGGQLAGSLTLGQNTSSGATDSEAGDPSVLLATTFQAPVSAVVERGPSSALTYDVQLQKANAGAVLTDWTSLGSLVTGTLTLNVEGDAPLTEGFLPSAAALTAIGQSFVADGGLSVASGPAGALVETLDLPPSSIEHFGHFGGPFRIEDGQVQMDTWTLRRDQFESEVRGAFGLSGSVDLEVTLELPLSTLQNSRIPALIGGEDGRIGALLRRLVGSGTSDETIPVTVDIGGTMQDPTVKVLNRDAVASKVRSLAAEAGLELLQNLLGNGE